MRVDDAADDVREVPRVAGVPRRPGDHLRADVVDEQIVDAFVRGACGIGTHSTLGEMMRRWLLSLPTWHQQKSSPLTRQRRGLHFFSGAFGEK
jgi:hypothetical protein